MGWQNVAMAPKKQRPSADVHSRAVSKSVASNVAQGDPSLNAWLDEGADINAKNSE
jgi:hypothetical protein